jgi:hypothetical protein
MQHYRNRGFKSGGERIVASAKILSRRILRILQAEAPGASAFFDHLQVHFSAFSFWVGNFSYFSLVNPSWIQGLK